MTVLVYGSEFISGLRRQILDAGVEASFIRQECKYTDAVRSDLISLDMNWSDQDGRQVMVERKQDPKLKSIQVFDLTTSSAESDIAKAYGLYTNYFFTRLVDLEQFIEIVEYTNYPRLSFINCHRTK